MSLIKTFTYYVVLIIYVYCHLVSQKKILTFVTLMLFTCVQLLSVFILLRLFVVCNWLLPLFVTIAISFYAFLITQRFVLFVLNIIQILGINFCLIPDIHIMLYNFTQCIMIDMFYILLIAFIVDLWSIK